MGGQRRGPRLGGEGRQRLGMAPGRQLHFGPQQQSQLPIVTGIPGGFPKIGELKHRVVRLAHGRLKIAEQIEGPDPQRRIGILPQKVFQYLPPRGSLSDSQQRFAIEQRKGFAIHPLQLLRGKRAEHLQGLGPATGPQCFHPLQQLGADRAPGHRIENQER